MRVLVVGGGAREHALCWRLAAEGARVWAAPGNAGFAPVATCLPVRADDALALADAARRQSVDLVVVGPEAPLVAGVADVLRARGLAVLGPDAAAARVEGSKGWARGFCRRHAIPAPRFEVAEDAAAAAALAARWPLPAVCKADGLMAGKGVVIATDRAEAVAAAQRLAAAGPVVFEEFLEGVELSAFALCDGRRACFYGLARDHKRLREGNAGPMTGGMGAYAPPPEAEDAGLRAEAAAILEAAAAGLAAEGAPFVGFLYAGLMRTPQGLRVLEFNCRLGDPEAQALLPLLAGEVLPAWLAAARGALPPDAQVAWRPGAAVGVVLASGGYPESPRTGEAIRGLGPDGRIAGAPEATTLCFHGATARDGETWRTAGGRVLTAVGLGADVPAARAAAYAAAARVTFPGRQLRADVAADVGAAVHGRT